MKLLIDRCVTYPRNNRRQARETDERNSRSYRSRHFERTSHRSDHPAVETSISTSRVEVLAIWLRRQPNLRMQPTTNKLSRLFRYVYNNCNNIFLCRSYCRVRNNADSVQQGKLTENRKDFGQRDIEPRIRWQKNRYSQFAGTHTVLILLAKSFTVAGKLYFATIHFSIHRTPAN